MKMKKQIETEDFISVSWESWEACVLKMLRELNPGHGQNLDDLMNKFMKPLVDVDVLIKVITDSFLSSIFLVPFKSFLGNS